MAHRKKSRKSLSRIIIKSCVGYVVCCIPETRWRNLLLTNWFINCLLTFKVGVKSCLTSLIWRNKAWAMYVICAFSWLKLNILLLISKDNLPLWWIFDRMLFKEFNQKKLNIISYSFMMKMSFKHLDNRLLSIKNGDYSFTSRR